MMNEEISQLLSGLKEQTIPFVEVIGFIDIRYEHQPTAFTNGSLRNEATQNQGSARVFGFAQINGLNEADTLTLFAEHYRSVLAHPEAADHQNIRQFMANGWSGIQFEGQALTARN